TALCSHGPVLPELLTALASRVDERADEEGAAAAALVAAAESMDKGEVVVCHLVDTGDAARVVAVERYP
ncbi:MAG: phosphohistidine phosphatase, partial [Lapillicoccus sp.]